MFPSHDRGVKGLKGGSIKKLDQPVNLAGSGWTNFILTIESRDVDPNRDYDFAPELGPFKFYFLWEQGFQGLPQSQFQRIALRYALGHILRDELPCLRCMGRGHWVSNQKGRTRHGLGVYMFGDKSKPCWRCLGYKVDPEFWDDVQARFGEFYDDPSRSGS